MSRSVGIVPLLDVVFIAMRVEVENTCSNPIESTRLLIIET